MSYGCVGLGLWHKHKTVHRRFWQFQICRAFRLRVWSQGLSSASFRFWAWGRWFQVWEWPGLRAAKRVLTCSIGLCFDALCRCGHKSESCRCRVVHVRRGFWFLVVESRISWTLGMFSSVWCWVVLCSDRDYFWHSRDAALITTFGTSIWLFCLLVPLWCT